MGQCTWQLTQETKRLHFLMEKDKRMLFGKVGRGLESGLGVLAILARSLPRARRCVDVLGGAMFGRTPRLALRSGLFEMHC